MTTVPCQIISNASLSSACWKQLLIGHYLLLFFLAQDGWQEWTLWSVCGQDNTQQRKRRCRHAFPTIDQCQGPDVEIRMCRYNVIGECVEKISEGGLIQ